MTAGPATHGAAAGAWRDARFAGMAWLASRAWLVPWVYAGHRAHPFREEQAGAYRGVANWWLNAWTTYDSQYFLAIAEQGYDARTSAFFPLYPLLMRTLASGETGLALAGVLISALSFVVALYLLLRLLTPELGERAARHSVLVLAFFPTAVFTMAVYTDALFLALTLAMLLAARRERWLLASLFGALAALTRNAGPVLAAVLLLECWRARGSAPRRWTDYLLACTPMVAFIAVQGYFVLRFGGVTLLEAQRSFSRGPSLPWMPILLDLQALVMRVPAMDGARAVVVGGIGGLSVAASVLVFVLAWRYRRRIAAGDLLLMVGVMLMQLCYARTFFMHTASSARYVLSTPAFAQGLALELDARSTRAVKVVLAAAAVLLSGAVAWLFGIKAFVA